MKKYLFILLIPVVALISSCAKGGGDEGVVQLPLAENDKDAVAFTIPDSESLDVPVDDAVGYCGISKDELAEDQELATAVNKGGLAQMTKGVFTESGQAIFFFDIGKETKAAKVRTIVGIGTYSFNGSTFTTALGTFTLSGKKLTANIKNTGEQEVTVQLSTAVANMSLVEAVNMLRIWTVKSTAVMASGGGLPATVGKVFNGCDINEIADYLISQKVSFDKDMIQPGLKVKNIDISKFGTITISFTGHSPYVATYSSIGKDAINGVKWIESLGNVLFDNPTVTVDFNKSTGEPIITFSTVIVNGSNRYDSSIEFTLIKA